MKDKLILFLSFVFLVGCSPAADRSTTIIPSFENTITPETNPYTQTPLEPTLTPEPSLSPTPISFSLTSPSFGSGEMIPMQFAREGDDISPPLEWGQPPEDTKSFALILYSDPLLDGRGNWVQWILYNIPADSRSLPQDIQPDQEGRLADGSQHFKNSWGELAYGGPNPQHVQTFKYYFVLYALDSTLDLDSVERQMEEAGTLPWIGSSKAVLEEAIAGHVLGLGKLTATYKDRLD